jgi:hypothetical protein
MTAPHVVGAEHEAAEARKYYGKYAGIVLNNDKPQNADHRGEVLVEVAGILEEDPADPTGATQRKLQVSAKPCLPPGFFFVPEPQDHVWVEFAGGEIDDPLWSGVWYPDAKPPQTPDGNPPTKEQKVIRTKFGHVVLFDDTSGSEKVVIKANDNWVTLDQSGIIKVEDKTNKNTITMDSNGIVLASGNSRKITISSSTVKLE